MPLEGSTSFALLIFIVFMDMSVLKKFRSYLIFSLQIEVIARDPVLFFSYSATPGSNTAHSSNPISECVIYEMLLAQMALAELMKLKSSMLHLTIISLKSHSASFTARSN